MAAAYVAQPKMLTLAFAPQCGSERLRLDRARAGLPPRHTPPAGLPPPASQCQSGSRPLCAALATMRQSRSRAGVRLVFRAWGQANDVLEVLVPACAQPATIATTGARGDLAAPATRRTTSATPERGPNGLPSESRQIAHRDPGWITLPPNPLTCSSAASISGTVKYGRAACRPDRHHVRECRAQDPRRGSASRDPRLGCARRARRQAGPTRTDARDRDHQPETRLGRTIRPRRRR